MHTKTEVKKIQMSIFMQIHQLQNCKSKVDACKYIFQNKGQTEQLNLKLTRLNMFIVHVITTVTQNL